MISFPSRPRDARRFNLPASARSPTMTLLSKPTPWHAVISKTLPRWIPLFAALSFLTGCDTTRPGICDDCNVVLIVADTLRADHLEAYGYHRATAPFFNEMVDSGVLFEQARSQASCTFPSVNSLLTSRRPSVFLDKATRPTIPASVRSLPEILSDHGYATAAVSASPIVRDSPSDHNPRGGFGAGFDTFDETCHWINSQCVSFQTVPLLNRLQKPFFLYLHFMDPHDPYQGPRTTRGLFARHYRGPHGFIADGDPNPLQAMIRQGTFDGQIDLERDLGYLKNRYDEGIRSFDKGLAEVMRSLESRDLLDKTLVIVTSDHGEAFYEHGEVKHCRNLYDSEIRVPLWIRAPGISRPGRVSTATPLLDLAPTVLDLLGLPPFAEHEGKSLRPLLTRLQISDPEMEALTFSAFHTHRAVTDGRFKLLTTLDDPTGDRLFDLSRDPEEQLNVIDDQRPHLHRLRQALRRWMAEDPLEGNVIKQKELGEEIEEELRSLGYIG